MTFCSNNDKYHVVSEPLVTANRLVAAQCILNLTPHYLVPCFGCLSLQTLRDLVFDPQGQRLATSLISVLVSDQLDAGGSGGGAAGVDDLAAALQAGAPSYFRDQDRQFYQVSSVCVCV